MSSVNTGKRNGKYWVRWRTPGGTRKGRTFDRKDDRDRFATEIRRTLQMGGVVKLAVEVPTLSEFVVEFWRRHAIPNLAQGTRDSYRLVWELHAQPRIGDYRLGELTPELLDGFRADLQRAGVGAATVRKTLAMVQSVLAKAVLAGHLEFNPMVSVRKPRYDRAREPFIFQPAAVEAVRARLSHRDRTLVSLLAYAGPRPEEALRVRWRDVGQEAVHFRDTKTHRERWTPLLGCLAQDLREWQLASGKRDGPVIPAHDGGHWEHDDWRNFGRRTWRNVAPEGSRPRDLRSSYITLRVYEGIPLTTIARECGTSLQMIDRHYAGVIANWDGRQVPADEQVRLARAELREATG